MQKTMQSIKKAIYVRTEMSPGHAALRAYIWSQNPQSNTERFKSLYKKLINKSILAFYVSQNYDYSFEPIFYASCYDLFLL